MPTDHFSTNSHPSKAKMHTASQSDPHNTTRSCVHLQVSQCQLSVSIECFTCYLHGHVRFNSVKSASKPTKSIYRLCLHSRRRSAWAPFMLPDQFS